MAITFVAAGAEGVNTSAATSLLVPYPTGLAANDVFVLAVSCSVATPASTPSGGWSSKLSITAGGLSPSLRMWVLKALGSETGNLTVTTSNSTSHGMIMAYRGVDYRALVDQASTEIDSSTGTSNFVIPAQTTSIKGCTIISAGIQNSAAATFTPPSSPAAFTELLDSSSQPSTTIDHLVAWTGVGSTGTITIVSSAGGARYAAGAIILKPALDSTYSSWGSLETSP